MPAILSMNLPVSGLVVYFTGSIEMIEGTEANTGTPQTALVGSSSLFLDEAHRFVDGADADQHAFHMNNCCVSGFGTWTVFELGETNANGQGQVKPDHAAELHFALTEALANFEHGEPDIDDDELPGWVVLARQTVEDFEASQQT